MSHGILQWKPIQTCPSLSTHFSHFPSLSIHMSTTHRRGHVNIITCSQSSEQLTAREKRQLRNERRESRTFKNWREEVEERLMKKPKKRKKSGSWTEQLNLDTLSLLGPQWWVVRVSRVSAHYMVDQLARSLARNYPQLDFKVYLPAIHVKRKLKNGSYSVKSNAIFPGCIFFHCVLNKEIHDFVRECIGAGGFLGSKVGSTIRQINRPKPVPIEDMEEIFRQVKEEQEQVDRAFEEQQRAEGLFNDEDTELTQASKPKRRPKKISNPSNDNPLTEDDHQSLVPGCNVQVLSGSFAEFTGTLVKLDRNSGKATVKVVLFGKESSIDLDIDQIAAETK